MEVINYYVDNILLTLYENDNEKQYNFKDKEISESVVKLIEDSILNKMICRLQADNSITDLGITVFAEKGISQVGITDMYNDIFYYYTNEIKDKTLIPITGNMFEKWMVCYDNEILSKIVLYFLKTGEKWNGVKWIEE